MSRVIIITLFTLGALGVGLVALLSRRGSNHIPTLGEMAGFVMEYRVGRIPVGRIGVMGFWWWVGWHFFAR